MPYVQETCVCGDIVEVSKYYSYHIGNKQIRGEYKAPTSDQQKKSNIRQAKKKLRRILNNNFKDSEDCLLTLTFKKEYRPRDSEELKKYATKFFRNLKGRYRKKGLELKYVYCLEVGPKGAVHIHAVVSGVETKLFNECWRWGWIDIKPLNSDGQYKGIADYFLKYSEKTEKTEAKIGKLWYGSRNLIKPVVKKKVLRSGKWRENPRPPKGFKILDINNGVSELTGLNYQTYTMIRLRI